MKRLAGALVAAPLAVYLVSLARGPQWGDSTELALAADTFSIPHPTGYPLYLLLGKLAACVPFGALPWRVGLVSALPVALAVAAVFALARRACGDDAPAAAAALSFAFWREPWEQAALPEVYGLELALLAGALLAWVRFLDEPGERRLALACSALGLGFAHHMQTVFLLPGVAVACAITPAARALLATRRGAGIAVAAGLVPLSLYGVLLVRAHQQPYFDEGGVGTLSGLAAHVTGRQFAYRVFGLDLAARTQGELARLAREIAGQPAAWWPLATPLLLVAGAGLGLRGLSRGQQVLAWGAAATCAVVTMGYQIPDKSAYYLTLHLVLALGLACGLALLDARIPADHRRLRLALLALAVALPLAANAGRCPRAGDTSLADYTADIAKLLPERALLVTDDLTLWWGFVYRQKVLGLDRERAYVCAYPMRLPWYVPFLRRAYPQLALPAGLEAELERGLALLREQGDASGRLSQQIADSLTGAVVEANLDRMPVALVLHATSEELQKWGPYAVRSLGLAYRVTRQPEPPAPYPADYADPERHRVDRVHGSDRQRVARRYSTSLNRLGILHLRAGQLGQAELSFRRALEYEPGYAQVYTNLGVLYAEHMNRPADAFQAYRKFLELAPADPQARAVEQWLVRYQQSLIQR